MHDIVEATKVDCAVYPQVGATSLTGEWFRMDTFAKALFIAQVWGQHNADDCTFAVYEATDAEGSGESQLGATITLAQGIKITMCTVTFASIDVDDTIIITPHTLVHGVLTAGTALTFTAKAAESLANRQFNQASTDTATATSFAACFNDATYGVPGVLATAAAAVVTITMIEPGDGTFTIVESDTTKSAVEDYLQQAHFEVAVQDLDRDNDFTHIGARFASIETDVRTSCQLIRAIAGYQPVGQVSAYSDDAS